MSTAPHVPQGPHVSYRSPCVLLSPWALIVIWLRQLRSPLAMNPRLQSLKGGFDCSVVADPFDAVDARGTRLVGRQQCASRPRRAAAASTLHTSGLRRPVRSSAP